MLWGGFISFAVAGSNVPNKGLAVILSLPGKMQILHFIPGVDILWFFYFYYNNRQAAISLYSPAPSFLRGGLNAPPAIRTRMPENQRGRVILLIFPKAAERAKHCDY
jgi:hypothetical protein